MRWKNFTTFFVIAALAVPALFAPTKRAEALFGCTPTVTPATPLGIFVPSYDAAVALQNSISNTYQSSNFSKECILDSLVTMLGKSLISNLTGSIVDWINNDFEGGPAFITDPAGFFVNVADETAGNFIETQLGPIGQLLCSPFDLRLRLNLWLSTGASRKQYLGCRLTDIQKNAYEAFTNGGFIANGGWNTFNALTSDPRNNQFGAFIYASDALNTEFIKKANEKLRELSYGRGFLSFNKCIASKAETNATGGHDCAKYETVTPGSLINSQLENVFGSELRQFELADEINEVFQALVNAGLRQVFAKGGGGLLGASSRGAGQPSSAAQRLRNQDFSGIYNLAQNDATTTNVFNSKLSSISNDYKNAGVGINPQGTDAGVAQQIPARNLALDRPAAGSPAFLNAYSANLAANGYKDGKYKCEFTLECAFISIGTTNPYWEVTLAKPSTITEVRIYKRVDDTYDGALGTFTLTIYDTDAADRKSVYSASFVTNNSSTIPFSITPINKVGKVVRIQRTASAPVGLGLGEVEVYGTEGETAINESPVNAITFSFAPETTNPLVAAVNEPSTLKGAFTPNIAISGAKIKTTLQHKNNLSGSYTNFAPKQAFDAFLVRVKNTDTNTVKFARELIKQGSVLVADMNNAAPYTLPDTVSALKDEPIGIEYEFTPFVKGQFYRLITEIVDTAGKTISGGTQTLQFSVPN